MNRETGVKRAVICGMMAAVVFGCVLFFRGTDEKTGSAGQQMGEVAGVQESGEEEQTAEAVRIEKPDGEKIETTDWTKKPGKEETGGELIQTEESDTLSQGQEQVPAFHEQSVKSQEEKETFIRMYKFLFPQELLALIERNEETVDFVYNYPELVRKEMNTEEYALTTALTEEESESAHPLLLQWDERWGAMPYGSSMMALSGCGPTCLAMAAVGLTGDSQVTPASVGMFSMEQGYYTVGEGTSWDLITQGCEAYGLRARSIARSEEEMVENLNKGRMLICSVSPGDFTQTGHFILIYGYKDGQFQINDPNSVIRSSVGWTFERLKGQLRNIWVMSVDQG